MNTYVLLVLDSCRYDSMAASWEKLKYIPQIGPLREAFSFATWTLPAHLNFMTGRLPWVRDSSTGLRFGSTELQSGLAKWEERLGIGVDRLIDEHYDMRPTLRAAGYETWAVVAARPIGPGTLFAQMFDRFNDVGLERDSLARALAVLRPETLERKFLVINICETHYPYWYGPGSEADYPRFPSWRSRVSRGLRGHRDVAEFELSLSQLDQLRERQQRAVQYIDDGIGELAGLLPAGSYITITADHGDCLGESNEFLHGEASDRAVLRVPLVEGPVDRVV